MGDAPPARPNVAADQATLPSPPASTEWEFSDGEGATWAARVAGTARTGVVADSGAALMLVRFFRTGEREPAKPRAELLTVARDPTGLYPGEWRAMLAEATRPRPDSRPTKRGRRGRRRGRR